MEIGEVESTLVKEDDVSDAVVLLHKTSDAEDADTEMVSFITLARGGQVTASDAEKIQGDIGLQTLDREVEARVRMSLQTQLPPYMIPSRLIALKQFPMNSNNKIDRKALAAALDTLPATSGKARDEIVSPRDEIEAVLCDVAAEILGVEAGITNNFFDLGGHSLVATQFVTFVSQRLGFRVSVKDVFDQPVLVDLAAKIRSTSLHNSGGDMSALVQFETRPFEMLQTTNPTSYIKHKILPLLPTQHHGRIVDVYPATQVQKIFLLDEETGYPRTPPVFYIDFQAETAASALQAACVALVEYFDILRTVFVNSRGKFYQVLLSKLEVPIEIIDTEDDLESATQALREADLRQPLRNGHSVLRIAILNKPDTAVRVVLRMSHALYDGLSFQHIVQCLHEFFRGEGRLVVPLNFAPYVRHALDSRHDAHAYWRSVLQNSLPTSYATLALCFSNRARPRSVLRKSSSTYRCRSTQTVSHLRRFSPLPVRSYSAKRPDQSMCFLAGSCLDHSASQRAAETLLVLAPTTCPSAYNSRARTRKA